MTALRHALDQSLTPAPTSRSVRLSLAGLLVLHLALSIWFGWAEPKPGRWWDERFNVLNIEAILQPGGFELANGYYGGVSYLPQSALLAAAQWAHESAGFGPRWVSPAGHLTPASYHLLRISQALWGTAALLLLFVIARRLLRPEGALLATILMGITPRLYHSSAIFKPDIELVAATLLALWASWLAARQEPSARLYLFAGAAIGLAVGAKLNGVAVAAPLALACCLRDRQIRRWAYLGLAAVTSFVTFWAFNPDLPRVLRSLQKNQEHYERTATGGAGEVLWQTLLYPFRENFHGPWIAGFGLLGIAAVVLWLIQPTAPRKEAADRRLGWWMLLSYPPVYYLLYALASPRAKANHFLQIIPFVALFAGVALGTLVIGLRRSALPASQLVSSILLAILLVPPFAGTAGWIYGQAVPSTWDQAQTWVESQLPNPHRAFEIATAGRPRRGRVPGAPVYRSIDLSSESLSTLWNTSDGLLILRQSTGGEQALPSDLPLSGATQREFPAGWFSARDEDVVALLRPRTPAEHPDSGRLRLHRDGAGQLSATLPPALAGETVSLRVRLSVGDRWAPKLRLNVGSEDTDPQSYPLTLGPASGGDIFLLSPRFEAPTAAMLWISLDGRELQPMAKAELFVWKSR